MGGLISVIVPVYNVEHYLNKCIESLMKQTYKNIEIILVNDGSTDRSGILCDEWNFKAKQIRVIHTENCGLSAARNVGIKHAKGVYIAFVDSDDWIEADMLETLIRDICICEADISSCGMKKDYDEQKLELRKNCERRCISQKQMFHEILCNKYVYGYVCNKLFKKELMNGLLFDEKLFSQEDMDFTMRYLQRCSQCVYTESEYYHYRQRIGSMTGEIGYNPRKLSIANVYERAISVYEKYCPSDVYIVERNYLKVNINIIGRMKVSDYKNQELRKLLEQSINQYYMKVLKDKRNSTGIKINIIMSYHLPATMLKLKQKLILKRRNV